MSDNRTDLPPVDSPNFLMKVRELLSINMGTRGDGLQRAVTVQDLQDANLITLAPGFLSGRGRIPPIGGAGSAIPGVYTPDYTPPPTPTGFAASAAISNILVECDAQAYTGGHGHAKSALYGLPWTSGLLPVFANALLLTEFPGSVFAYATNPTTTWHLWLKWISADGVASVMPAGGTNGLVVTTGLNVEKLVKAMTGPGNPFKIVAEAITLADGTIVPVGTYTADAYIHNSQITNAKIANLAVDNAKIADLSVSKLTAGSMAVGAYIQSTNYVAGSVGWRISANGIAELSNAVVRGAVYANAGYIGNNTIDGTGMQSAGYVPGAAGWRMDSGGTLNASNAVMSGTVTATAGSIGGNIISAGGMQSANFASGYAGWRLDSGGNLEANNGVFRGTLRANIVGTEQMELASATDLSSFEVSVPANQESVYYMDMATDGPVLVFVDLPPPVHDSFGDSLVTYYPDFYYRINHAAQRIQQSSAKPIYLPAGSNSFHVYATYVADGTYSGYPPAHAVVGFTVLKLYR